MTPKSDCERWMGLELARVGGCAPSAEEAAFLDLHAAACAACGTERRALDALKGEENSGPLPELDDVSRRRFVDDILSRADAAERRSAAHPSSPRNRLAIAAHAVIAAAAVVAFVLWWRPGGEADHGALEEAGERAAPVRGETARVLLASGIARAAGAAAAVGDGVAAGETLETGDGALWIGLPTDFTLALESGTQVTAKRIDAGALVFSLERGRVVIAAVPGRSGPRLSIVTRKGAVRVTGTVLTVEDRGDSVEVLVARGSVELDDGLGTGPRRLGVSEIAVLGEERTRAPTKEDEDALIRSADAFDLVDAADSGRLDVRSVPVGAVLSIDGSRMGVTPLVAAVRAGHRRLEIALEGRQTVRELVDVSPGSRLTRVFDLRGEEPAPEPLEAPEEVEDFERSGALRTSPGAPGAASAQSLLRRAQERRAARDYKGAARAYQELLSAHPASDEARSALVSLGQMELEQLGRPRAAMRHFDAYLSEVAGGSLEREAAMGRARALGALGRIDEERAALERFLARFPNAIQAPRAKARLEEIAAGERAEGDPK